MDTKDIGVKRNSILYVHSPTTFAKQALITVDRGGDYSVDKNYVVDRDALNAYIIFVVNKGILHLDYCNKTFSASQGAIMFIDCNKPHKYYTTDNASFKWFHLNGHPIKYYAELLDLYNNPIFYPQTFASINTVCTQIFDQYSSKDINEHKISLLVGYLLSSLASSNEIKESTTKQIVVDSVKYIRQNFNQDLSVNNLATELNISVYHFIRMFKKIYNCTPHEYILNERLTHAKRLLLTTNLTISEIALSCGFSNSPNFIRAFKKSIGYTPTKFRQFGN